MKKEVGMILDDDEIMNDSIGIVETIKEEAPKRRAVKMKSKVMYEDEPISCLRDERIIVRFVPKQTGLISNPKHILYGGMSENATRWFTLPKLSSGLYINALTDNEKNYLEEIMGVEDNALSIYKKVDNFWDNTHVRLNKQDNFLNLTDPDDYIKYKILLANKDIIAASLQELQDKPKATYQFVLIREGEETRNTKREINSTMQSYMRFGEIKDNADMLRVIIETIDGRPMSANTKIEYLQEKINKLIQADSKLFLRIAEDPLLEIKTLIKRGIEASLISNRGGSLFLKDGNVPLCEDNEEPTLNVAAKFLSTAKRQTIKFSLEAKLKK